MGVVVIEVDVICLCGVIVVLVVIDGWFVGVIGVVDFI